MINKPAAFMLYDAFPDIDSSAPNGCYFYLEATRLTTGKQIIDKLWCNRNISLREVANNLDGDFRFNFDPTRRFFFGELVRCAIISEALDFLENPPPFPAEYESILNLPLNESSLLQDMEESLDQLIEATSNELMSYLFGRNYNPNSTSVEMEDMWLFASDVMWELVSAIKEAIPKALELFEILISTDGYLSGYWEQNTISLYLYTDDPHTLDQFNFRGKR